MVDQSRRRRRRGPLALAVATVVTLGVLLSVWPSTGSGDVSVPATQPNLAQHPRPQAAPGSPNIVFVVVDDLDTESMAYLPRLRRELTEAGTSFTRSFVTDSLCCSSRTSILRSQYVHNHHVLDNVAPEGGYVKFRARGLERSTVGTWMHRAGYRTSFMGKYLNAYPTAGAGHHVPAGWDDWHAGSGARPYRSYDYTLVENGHRVSYGHRPRDYLTDVLSRKADRFVRKQRRHARPFFLYLAPFSPHAPAIPPPRYAHRFDGLRVPRTANYDTQDMTGLPVWERLVPRLTPHEKRSLDAMHRDRLRSMLGVEDMVVRLIRTLRRTGQLDDTYVVFTSDNGFHLGQHRLGPGKRTAYEEDIRVPLVVRGPGVPAGRRVDAMTSTVDLAPTFADLGGARVPRFADGRSLVRLFHGRATPPGWRRTVLLERANESAQGVFDPDRLDTEDHSYIPMPSYDAIRTPRYTYVEYVDGETELYDTAHDPLQLTNLSATADPELLRRLSTTLHRLAHCAGPSCRRADRQGP